jgi:hypothetical protein
VVLGFEPHESLVVVALAGPRPGFSVRVDLPPPGDAALAARLGEQAAAAVAVQGATRAAVLGFSRDLRCETTLLRVADVVRSAGVDVVDVVRTDGARYWSLVCADPRCCPPEGSGYDPRASRLRAEATWAGIAVAPHRDAVAARLAPCSGAGAARMRSATVAAERKVLTELGLPAGPPGSRPPAGMLQATGEGAARGVGHVDALLDRLLERLRDRRSGEVDGVRDAEAAQLSVWCAVLVVRDLAWSRIDCRHAGRYVALWSAVARRVVAPYEPPVLSLAGFAAWVGGDGVTAWCAVDRALAADPAYSMARLLADALDRCVPPDVWVPPPRDLVLAPLRPSRPAE